MADDVTPTKHGARVPSRFLDPFRSFRTEMDRLFDSFLGGPPAVSGLGQGFSAGLAPSLDVKESDSEVVVRADLPGIDEKDINLTIHNGVLCLRGEKKSEHTDERDNYHLMERSYGSFERSVRLPESIDEDKAEAKFDKGVLTVTLPKRPDAVKAQKTIEIKAA
jgi:HSP20 family protein